MFVFIWYPLEYSWISPTFNGGKEYDVEILPPPYPNGWYRLCGTNELSSDKMMEVKIWGKSLLVTKTSKGYVCMDAYCNHMGANLVDGVVKNDCITCPFHNWKFSTKDGSVVDIPGIQNVPSFIKQQVYETMEANGVVFVWLDSDGRRGEDIPFRVWKHPTMKTSTYPFPGVHFNTTHRYHGTTEHFINAHLQELPENGSDLSHFSALHQDFIVDNWFLKKLFKHDMKGIYDTSGNPVLKLKVLHDFRIFGKSLSQLHTTVYQSGPGSACLVIEQSILGIKGEIVIAECVQPIGPLRQRTTHTCNASWFFPRWLVKIIFKGMIIQYERDAIIFDRKMFISNPNFTKLEQNLIQFRRWFRQFYSPTSLSMVEALKRNHTGGVMGPLNNVTGEWQRTYPKGGGDAGIGQNGGRGSPWNDDGGGINGKRVRNGNWLDW